MKAYSTGCGKTTSGQIKNKALNDVAIDLGYRSFSHLRTKGKKDLALCYSEALTKISIKLADQK